MCYQQKYHDNPSLSSQSLPASPQSLTPGNNVAISLMVTKMNEFENDRLTEKIIAACFAVHNELGPGFKENAYKNSLKIALKKCNLTCESEKTYLVHFKDCTVGKLRVDLIVENKIIIEVKAVKGFMPKLFESQIIAYLKAAKLKTGLLINFGNRKCSIRRLMNDNFHNQPSHHCNHCPITPHHRNQSQRERR